MLQNCSKQHGTSPCYPTNKSNLVPCLLASNLDRNKHYVFMVKTGKTQCHSLLTDKFFMVKERAMPINWKKKIHRIQATVDRASPIVCIRGIPINNPEHISFASLRHFRHCISYMPCRMGKFTILRSGHKATAAPIAAVVCGLDYRNF